MNSRLEILTGQIGEAIYTDYPFSPEGHYNIFHRPPDVFHSGTLSTMVGMVANGIRGTALLKPGSIDVNLPHLETAVRHYLPMVINVVPDFAQFSTGLFEQQIKPLYDLDCMLFRAGSMEEHEYLLLFAHRVAELALLPVVIIGDYASAKPDTGNGKDFELTRTFLGNPADLISSPTAAQEIIFGKNRRRIPNWFSFENPVSLGMEKESQFLSFESVARKKYFYNHLDELIDRIHEEFKSVFHYDLIKINTPVRRKSDYAVVSWSSAIETFYPDLLSRFTAVDFIRIHQINPFPARLLRDRIGGKKGVTILQPLCDRHNTDVLFHNVSGIIQNSKVEIYSGFYGSECSVHDLAMAVENMWSPRSKATYYLGIPLIKEHSDFPKHQVLLQDLEKRYPELAGETLKFSEPHLPLTTSRTGVPELLRRHLDRGPQYTRLSRFYDHMASFYQHGAKHELIADPFAALPLAPAVTGGFEDQSNLRTMVPLFNPAACSGCGDCMIHCPQAAIPSVSISIEALLRTGARIVSSQNMAVTRLTPLIKNIARTAAKMLLETPGDPVQDILNKAFHQVVQMMRLDADKLEVAHSELTAVLSEIGDFPFSVNEHFFLKPENIDPGSGELFSLVIDPVLCTGCGICTQICPEQALQPAPNSDENNRQLKRLFDLWEQLPDTPGDTLRRLQHDPEYSSLAATLLSRNFYRTIVGGHSEWIGEDKKIMHIITALSEAALQPGILNRIRKTEELIEALTTNVHKKLGEAIPTDNLERLSGVLPEPGRRKISLSDLIIRARDELKGKLIDLDDLQRKTELIKDLKNLRWLLEEGPGGMGRSRYGIVVAGEALGWAGRYPFNPFTQPVFVHRGGNLAGEVIGLFRGQVRHQIDSLKLLRRADLEVGDQYDPSRHDLAVAEMEWDTLNAGEKEWISPLLVVVDRASLDAGGWSDLLQILSAPYPVKVLLLDDLGFTPGDTAAVKQVNASVFSVLSAKNAFIFQGALTEPDHFFDAIMEGLRFPGPALFRIFSANFSLQRSSDPLIEYGRLALDCRALPLLKFNPGLKKDFLRGAIELDANRFPREDWVTEKFELPSGELLEYSQSWADWAFSQKTWETHFRPWEGDGRWDLVPNYLKRENGDQEQITPVIIRLEGQELKYYAVSEAVVNFVLITRDFWQTLREIAGTIYEFPRRLQEEMERKMTIQMEEKIRKIEAEFALKLRDKENEQLLNIREKLKEKLITLSLQSKNKNGN